MANAEHLAILRQGVEVWNKWRKENPDMRIDLTGANLSKVDLSEFDLSRTDLVKANLSEADLFKTDLVEANLTGADLRKAGIIRTELLEANLTKANLSGADVSLADLRWANLTKANLSKASFGAADVSEANLTKADLSEADLSEIRAVKTNFTAAKFTGACLEDWSINSDTKLDDVDCQYVYLKSNKQERRPHDENKNFAPGEFTKLFQKTLETVDLIFHNGINWQVFFTSFQKLQIECGGEELTIQSIENKNDGTFVIRVNVPLDGNKAEIEKYLKREYELELKATEEKYRIQLQAKDEQIEIYRQQSTNLTDIVKLLAGKTTNDFRGAQFAGGFINAQTVQSNQIGGDIYNSDKRA